MIDEYGVVTQERGGKLAIRVVTPGTCESCAIHDNCYASGKVVWIPKQEGIQVHDHVRFSIANTSVLGLSALVYGIPLLAVLGGILLGYLLLFRSVSGDAKVLFSVFLGVALFVASGFVISRLEHRIKRGLAYSVVRVDSSETDQESLPRNGDGIR